MMQKLDNETFFKEFNIFKKKEQKKFEYVRIVNPIVLGMQIALGMFVLLPLLVLMVFLFLGFVLV